MQTDRRVLMITRPNGAGNMVLHADNGSPMKGATMLATLQRLGVMASFSRPSVSDDNPYSESLFRTLKYTPAYLGKPFAGIGDARLWVQRFVNWYNSEHRHSVMLSTKPPGVPIRCAGTSFARATGTTAARYGSTRRGCMMTCLKT